MKSLSGHLRIRSIFLSIVFLLLVLTARSSIAQAMTNLGNILYLQHATNTTVNLPAAQSYWERALWFDGRNANAAYALARSAYATGMLASALEYTQQGLAAQPNDRRLRLLLGDIYIASEEPALALEAYESIGSLGDPHRLTYAYQRWGEALLQQDHAAALVAFERAFALNQNSLYTLYQLSQLDSSYTDLLRQGLSKPSSEAWLRHPQSLAYDAYAAILACQDGLISCEAILNLLHFATWLGDADRLLPIIAAFCTASSVDPHLCSQLLHDVCVASAFTDERCHDWQDKPVAPAEEHYLGNNLIAHAGFEEGNDHRVEGWQWMPAFAVSSHPRLGAGYFVGGRDCTMAAEDQCSLRVQGLWREEVPGRLSPRAGYASQRVQLQAGRCYRLAFLYRTSPYTDSTTPGLNLGLLPSGGEVILPDTAGEWMLYQMDVRPETDRTTSLTLRMWGQGAVWYDQVRFYEIGCGGE